MHKISIRRESNLIEGHVLDVSRRPLLAALRRYDPQLYLKWNAKKRGGIGVWELRRKPELKSVREGRFVDSPTRGRVYLPGDVYDMGDYTIVVPREHENNVENHVKDFVVLSYEILSWVAGHDLWNYGYRGKDTMNEAEYREAKYLEKEEEAADAERQYMIKQHRTQFNDFREHILSGGDPTRLVDYWDKV